MDAWLVALIGIQMTFVIAIIFIAFKHSNAKEQRKAELQARILEKFESPQELTEFLASSEGENLLHVLAPPPRDPRAALVSGTKAALVLFFLGSGCAFVGFYINDNALMVPAFICLGLAVGIGAASVVGHRLSKDQDPRVAARAASISNLTD
jgi:hypothetical protein